MMISCHDLLLAVTVLGLLFWPSTRADLIPNRVEEYDRQLSSNADVIKLNTQLQEKADMKYKHVDYESSADNQIENNVGGFYIINQTADENLNEENITQHNTRHLLQQTTVETTTVEQSDLKTANNVSANSHMTNNVTKEIIYRINLKQNNTHNHNYQSGHLSHANYPDKNSTQADLSVSHLPSKDGEKIHPTTNVLPNNNRTILLKTIITKKYDLVANKTNEQNETITINKTLGLEGKNSSADLMLKINIPHEEHPSLMLESKVKQRGGATALANRLFGEDIGDSINSAENLLDTPLKPWNQYDIQGKNAGHQNDANDTRYVVEPVRNLSQNAISTLPTQQTIVQESTAPTTKKFKTKTKGQESTDLIMANNEPTVRNSIGLTDVKSKPNWQKSSVLTTIKDMTKTTVSDLKILARKAITVPSHSHAPPMYLNNRKRNRRKHRKRKRQSQSKFQSNCRHKGNFGSNNCTTSSLHHQKKFEHLHHRKLRNKKLFTMNGTSYELVKVKLKWVKISPPNETMTTTDIMDDDKPASQLTMDKNSKLDNDTKDKVNDKNDNNNVEEGKQEVQQDYKIHLQAKENDKKKKTEEKKNLSEEKPTFFGIIKQKFKAVIQWVRQTFHRIFNFSKSNSRSEVNHPDNYDS